MMAPGTGLEPVTQPSEGRVISVSPTGPLCFGGGDQKPAEPPIQLFNGTNGLQDRTLRSEGCATPQFPAPFADNSRKSPRIADKIAGFRRRAPETFDNIATLAIVGGLVLLVRAAG